MAKKSNANKNKKFLKREYHLPVPDNKVGEVLSRPVKGPKFWQKLVAYVRESRQELKKVTWPTRKESIRLTAAVIIFTGAFVAFTSVLDYIFETFVQNVLI